MRSLPLPDDALGGRRPRCTCPRSQFARDCGAMQASATDKNRRYGPTTMPFCFAVRARRIRAAASDKA